MITETLRRVIITMTRCFEIKNFLRRNFGWTEAPEGMADHHEVPADMAEDLDTDLLRRQEEDLTVTDHRLLRPPEVTEDTEEAAV